MLDLDARRPHRRGLVGRGAQRQPHQRGARPPRARPRPRRSAALASPRPGHAPWSSARRRAADGRAADDVMVNKATATERAARAHLGRRAAGHRARACSTRRGRHLPAEQTGDLVLLVAVWVARDATTRRRCGRPTARPTRRRSATARRPRPAAAARARPIAARSAQRVLQRRADAHRERSRRAATAYRSTRRSAPPGIPCPARGRTRRW